MIHTVHPPVKQPAREGHFQLIAIRCAGRRSLPFQRRVQRSAVDLANRGNVFRSLEAALDFEGSHARLEQRWDVINSREVLRRKEIFFIPQIFVNSIHNQIVRHSTRLGTFPTIRTPLAKRLACKTLPGICYTKCAMDKDLKRCGVLGVVFESLQFPQGNLPPEHYAPHAKVAGKAHTLGGGDGHLRGRVNGQVRDNSPREFNQPDILHNNGIHA